VLPAPLFFADLKPADLSKNFNTFRACTGCNRILSKPQTTLNVRVPWELSGTMSAQEKNSQSKKN
jgi:hypothetical protein